jgi:hypothetical protein
MNRLLYILLMASLQIVSNQLQSQTIVTLNGNPTFDTSVLMVTEAGNDFSALIAEIQSNTTINIRNNSVNNPNNYDYKLYVNLVEMPTGLNITIQRTGPGTSRSGGGAQGKITGTMTPVTLSTIPFEFIDGTGDRLNVPVRFGLNNLSVTQPAGNVPVTLVFTATGN